VAAWPGPTTETEALNSIDASSSGCMLPCNIYRAVPSGRKPRAKMEITLTNPARYAVLRNGQG